MSRLFGQLFGNKFPDTSKYETQINNLRADFERFNKYESSAYYHRFLELDELVHSGEFEKRVKKLKTEKFKHTEPFRRFKNYKSISKSKDIRSFFKFRDAGHPQRISKILDSETYKEYEGLKTRIASAEFQDIKSRKGFKKTPDYEPFIRYKKLRRSADIKFVNRILHSASYKNYQRLNNSERLKNYTALSDYINSREFLDFKALMEDPQRFKKSEEYQLINELKEIKSTPDFIWYIKTKKENLFDELHKWELTFNEDFDSKSLDTNKWITGYYWGKALMNDTYVLANEKQFFRDQNIEVRDSIARIVTKTESCKGKIWDPQYGFRPKDFDFSSGLISTGQSFRQLYGKFEAKIRLNHATPLSHAFWMVSEKVAPQIDVLRYNNKSPKKLDVGCHLADGSSFKHVTHSINGANYSDSFFIYSLEWSKEKLIWKINGVVVHEQSTHIPQESMYLVFSSHLTTEKTPSRLSSSIEVDWVRCYKHV